MDGQPFMNSHPAEMSLLMQAGYLPPTDQYSTFLHLFPGNNAHAPWGTAGRFRVEVYVFVNGKEAGRIESGECDEKGNLRVEISPAVAGSEAAKGMFIVHYHHAKDIPVEVYAFHVHKATGTYVSCNITPFIGDKLFPEVHGNQMENTVFWPGIIADEENDPVAVVVNPYDETMGFQIHLIAPEGIAARSDLLRLKAKSAEEIPLCRIFDGLAGEIRKRNGKYSYCVSSQYKTLAYFMLRNRTHDVIAMMDHLHTFCLA